MISHHDLNKIMLIGAGPNIVGAVSELDLMAKQAIDAFLEDEVQVVLVNSNPATVASDHRPGVKVYLEPMTLSFLKRILRMEEPDAIVTAFGSTVGLRLTRELFDDGILTEMGIKLLTINPKALHLNSQAHEMTFLKEAGLPIAQSWQVDSKQDTSETLPNFDYPLLITKYHRYVRNDHFRIKNTSELSQFWQKEKQKESFTIQDFGFTEDLSDWEEIILDVLRDDCGNVNFVSQAASLESVAINSGDSVLVTPILTLNNDELEALKKIAKKIIVKLSLVGIMSVHFAVRHLNDRFIIKVLAFKPRITRSALMGYRAGVYSVGYVTAKIALGYRLDEITDPQSNLNAAVEPIFDTIAVKTPLWSFADSGYNHYQLNSRMQSGGEAIGIGRNFESAFLKALQSTTSLTNDENTFLTALHLPEVKLNQKLSHLDEMHLIYLLAALFRDYSYAKLHPLFHIHPVYFQKLRHLAILIRKIYQAPKPLSVTLLSQAKHFGLPNELIAYLRHTDSSEIQNTLEKANIKPSYIKLDGSAGLYPTKIEAYYNAYGVANEVKPIKAKNKVLIIGIKPFQVSQTSEFDYMVYHATQALKASGMTTILISNNPEAISAGYDVVDRVYFEPITLENIINVAHKENITQIVIQFSGKQVNQYRDRLSQYGLKILGVSSKKTGNKKNLVSLIEHAQVKQVPSLRTNNFSETLYFAHRVKFPLLIGGVSHHKKNKSAVVFDVPALKRYIDENELEQINISKFISGRKYEVTAISDGHNVTIPGIIEHFEQSGSHASDSIAVFPAQNLSAEQIRILRDATVSIVSTLKIKGPLNLNFLIHGNQIFCLQIKTYFGHNVAFLSKALNRDITQIATLTLLGQDLTTLDLPNDVWPSNDLIHVKMPVYSLLNYHSENTFDSKMKTAGSVLGRDTELSRALYKGYEASGLQIPSFGTVFISVKDTDKKAAIKLARRFHRLGFKLIATEGTANILAEAGLTTGIVAKIQTGNNSLLDKIFQHRVKLIINITNLSDIANRDAIVIKDYALNTHIPVFASIQSANFILEVLESLSLTTQPI